MKKPCIPQLTKATLLAPALLALGLFASSARAQGTIDQAAVNKANDFLKTTSRGRDTLSYLHFGAKYVKHTYQSTMTIKNKPGDFALVYRYHWENDGITDLAFLCDAKGYIYAVQVPYSNAQLSQPFALANASITVVGNLLLETLRENMTAEEIQQARRMIDNPDSRGLMVMFLKLQQNLGR